MEVDDVAEEDVCCTASLKWENEGEIVEDDFRLTQKQADDLMAAMQSPAPLLVVPTSPNNETWLIIRKCTLTSGETIHEDMEQYKERTRWKGLWGRDRYEAKRRAALKAEAVQG